VSCPHSLNITCWSHSLPSMSTSSLVLLSTLRNWRRRESALWTEQCWPRSKSSHCNVSENEEHNTYIDVCPWRFDFSIAQAEADSLSEKEHNLNRLLKLLWNDLLSCNNKKSSFIFIWRLFSANIDKYDSLLNLIIN